MYGPEIDYCGGSGDETAAVVVVGAVAASSGGPWWPPRDGQQPLGCGGGAKLRTCPIGSLTDRSLHSTRS